MDSNSANAIQITGIVVNTVVGAITLALMYWLGKRQIQATLQSAQPAPKARRPRRLTRIQQRQIKVFRLVQLLVLISIPRDWIENYWFLQAAPGKLTNLTIAIGVIGEVGGLIVFFQVQRLIRRIKAGERDVLIRLGLLKPRPPKSP